MDVWIIVPAAGTGSRFVSEIPKQYQPLLGKTVLEWTLEKLLALQPRGVVVAVNPADKHWRQLPIIRQANLQIVEGGESRAESVQRALASLQIEEQQWVMVHDAARPCVRVDDIGKLYQALRDHPVGGILAAPLSDTLKLANADDVVEKTLSRDNLWRALTPQMFRFGLLCDALQQGLASGATLTDEASAIEAAGFSPQLVAGHSDNIKITHRQDLIIAEAILRGEPLCE